MSLQPPPARRRALVIAVAVGAAAVVAGVAIGYLTAPSFEPADPSASPSGASTLPRPPSPSPSSPSPSKTTPASIPGLPASDEPLTDSQLVVPILRGSNWDIYLGDTTADEPGTRVVGEPGNDSFPVLSADRRTIIYVHWADNTRSLRVVGADGTGDRVLFPGVSTACAGRITRPAWNPTDPTVLAVPCINARGEYGLYLMHTDGSLIRSIDLGGKKVGDPTWSDDGTKLAFWAGDATSKLDGGAIYLADGTGKQVRKVSDGKPGQDADPAFNPAGDTVVFRRRVSEQVMDIYAVPGDGSSAPKVLLKGTGLLSDPSWSPTGKQIAVNAHVAYQDEPVLTRVWIMNSDGSLPRPLWTTEPTVGREQSTAAWTRR